MTERSVVAVTHRTIGRTDETRGLAGWGEKA